MDALHIHQVATTHPAGSELAKVMPKNRAEPMPVALFYPHRQHLPRRLKVFADRLAALLKERLFA